MEQNIETIQRSLALIEAALESTGDGIIIVSNEGEIIIHNHKFTDLWNLPDDWYSLSTPAARFNLLVERVKQPLEFLKQITRMSAPLENESYDLIQLNDGTTLEHYARPYQVEDKIIGRVWTFRDITDRLRTEERLRLAQFSLDRSADGVVWLAKDGHYLYVNDAVCDLLGYSHEEMLTRTVFDIYPSLTPELWQKQWEMLQEKGAFTFETLIGHKEGFLIPVEITINYLQFNSLEYLCAFSRDITERKQAEAAIQQRTSELTLLHQISQMFSSSLELDQVLKTILDQMKQLLDVTATSFWLLVPETGELVCQHANGPQNEVVIGWRLSPGQGITGHAAQTGHVMLVGNMEEDERHFRGVDKETGLALRSILSIPLRTKGGVIGVLNLTDTQIDRFNQHDLTLLEPIAGAAANAIENARLYEASQQELRERQRVEAELRDTYQSLKRVTDRLRNEMTLAHRIQRSLLPPPKPNWGRLHPNSLIPEVACFSQAARDVGGDFYTYHTLEGNLIIQGQPVIQNYALAVGDVSGKGMPAALLMAVSLASLRAVINHSFPPDQLLAHLDQVLVPYTHTTRQNCALCYLELAHSTLDDVTTWQLSIVNAGCIAPIIKRQADQTVDWLDIGGIPLGVGVGREAGYEEIRIELFPGDLIIMMSDGVIEAHNEAGDMFGFEQFETLIQQGPPDSASAMLEYLKKELFTFMGAADLHDDLTLVVIRV